LSNFGGFRDADQTPVARLAIDDSYGPQNTGDCRERRQNVEARLNPDAGNN
jgi:hypothetical protein